MAQATKATFKIWRTHPGGDGTYQTFTTEVSEGMVVLDVIHKIQATQANDLSVRWNCKAGKCGSCSAEINGMPEQVIELSSKPRFPQQINRVPRIQSVRCVFD